MKAVMRIALWMRCFGILVNFLAMSDCLLGQEGETPELQFPFETKLAIESLEGAAGDFFDQQTYPTEAVKVSRPLAEWEPAAAVWLNLAARSMVNNTGVNDFYRELIEVISRYIPVWVGMDENGFPDREIFIQQLLPEKGQISDRYPIIFFDSRIESYWNRDYGPSYAVSEGGGIVFIDAIYRGLESEMALFASSLNDLVDYDLERSLMLFQRYQENGRRVEVAPLFLAKQARESLGLDIDLVRPFLFLHGGDYMTDGSRRVFISQDTLLANGGRKRRLEDTFASFFGCEKLLVLDALPGNAVKHLDLSMKLLAEDVLIMGEPPLVDQNTSRYARSLVKQARRGFEANRAYLEEHAPEIRVIPIPTPPIAQQSREEIVVIVCAQVIQAACTELGLPFDSYWYVEAPGPDFEAVKATVDGRLRELAKRPVSLLNEVDLDILTRFYLGASLESLIEGNVEGTTLYRSYTNSLLVNTIEHGMVILLPRYRPGPSESRETFVGMEQQVESAYRSVYPSATLHWIESDVMVRLGGALHCLSMIVPQG